MALNDAAMVVAANALRSALAYGQLHSATAGSSGTSNVTSAGRQPISWAGSTGSGNFSLSSQINFTGGAASGPVYSMTLWSASSGGTFYGEFVITAGDTAFDSSGNFSWTVLDMAGAAT